MNTKCLLTGVVAVAVAALVLAFVGPATAGEGKEEGQKGGAFMGTIESVDAKARTLKVKNESSSMTFEVAKEAKIATSDKKSASLSDLKVGDEVKVEYHVAKGLNVAHQIAPKQKEEAARQPGEKIN
jgi:hypothetical protein